MARIAGVTLPNKKIHVALTYIYGIGNSLSAKILAESSIDPNIRANELSEADVSRLKILIEKNYHVEGDLRREVMSHIKRLKDISCYRGYRHARGLPARGQRTKTNSRTVRGNVRKTMGSGRRVSAQKT